MTRSGRFVARIEVGVEGKHRGVGDGPTAPIYRTRGAIKRARARRDRQTCKLNVCECNWKRPGIEEPSDGVD